MQHFPHHFLEHAACFCDEERVIVHGRSRRGEEFAPFFLEGQANVIAGLDVRAGTVCCCAPVLLNCAVLAVFGGIRLVHAVGGTRPIARRWPWIAGFSNSFCAVRVVVVPCSVMSVNGMVVTLRGGGNSPEVVVDDVVVVDAAYCYRGYCNSIGTVWVVNDGLPSEYRDLGWCTTRQPSTAHYQASSDARSPIERRNQTIPQAKHYLCV